MNILFTSINQQPIAIQLNKVGEPVSGVHTYTTDSESDPQQYTVGDWITSESGFIDFDFNGRGLDSTNYYQFATSGAEIAISGEIPADQYEYRWYNLFKGCKNIVDASNVEITNSCQKYACANLFADCTGLKTPPVISVSGSGDWGFTGLFYNCKALTAAPSLTGSLAKGCYSWMFYNCTSLSTAPQLPVTNLEPFCYNSMFQNCLSLTTAPVLSATTLKNGCYKNMFMGCKNLSSITVSFTEWDKNYTEKWVQGVASYGTFNRPNALAEQYSNDKIPLGWDRVLQTITIDQIPTIILDEDNISADISQYVHYSGLYNLTYMINSDAQGLEVNSSGVIYYTSTDFYQGEVNLIVFASDSKPAITNISVRAEYYSYYQPLTFKAKKDDTCVIQLNKVGSPSAINLQYKINNEPWTKYKIGDYIALRKNDVVSFSGNNDHFSHGVSYNGEFEVDYYQFAMSGQFESYGNVMSLMNWGNSVDSFGFYGLFSGCTELETAPLVPATELSNHCYRAMFADCSDLRTAPQLPATTLAEGCYQQMFQGCRKLKDTPNLPATTAAQACYMDMFSGCTTLTGVPSSLPDSVSDYSFLGMFADCRSLSTVPQLPAIELGIRSYQGMFAGCNKLSAGPSVLPATTLAEGCYQSMFANCYSLTNSPVISASTLYSYRQCCYEMFNYCWSLSSITVCFTQWGHPDTHNWVLGVASAGVFTKPSALTEHYGHDYIPNGWTVVDL